MQKVIIEITGNAVRIGIVPTISFGAMLFFGAIGLVIFLPIVVWMALCGDERALEALAPFIILIGIIGINLVILIISVIFTILFYFILKSLYKF